MVSALPVSAEELWRRVSTPAGVNDELWPFRMHLDKLDLAAPDASRALPGGGVLISLFGVLPLDWHWLGLESVTPGGGFHEVSSSLWMRRWVHVRTIEPAGEHSTLRDHVELTPRLGLLAPLLAPVYRAVFRRRHRRLRRYLAKKQAAPMGAAQQGDNARR
jgi:ligand-binding SRPBCC domain-containing protein